MVYMMQLVIVLILSILSIQLVRAEFPIHIPFYRLYERGIDAYATESWEDAINNFEWSLAQREHHANSTIHCLKKCKHAELACSVDICQFPDHRHSYELIREFQCMTNCKSRKLRSIDYLKAKDYNKLPDKNNLLPFVSGSIYDYLQYCYYKMGNKQNSTEALRTFLVFDPNNTRALGNLKFMRAQFEEGEVVPEPRQTPRFLSLYDKGMTAYSNEKWIECVDLLEESLQVLLDQIEECKEMCEDVASPKPPLLIFTQQYLTVQVKAHLQCQHNCYLNSTHVGGYQNLLFTTFLYLQFSYYQLKELPQAVIAAKTAQLIYPTNSAIIEYLDFYSKEIGDEFKQLSPRQEVNKLMDELEKVRVLTQTVTDTISTSFPPDPPDYSEQELTQDSQDFIAGSRLVRPVVVSPPTNFTESRVLVDGFISEVECKQLVLLADQLSTQGDGYSHTTYGANSSPHTPFEKFSGVTLDAAVSAWEREAVAKKLVLFYFEAAERNRVYLEEFFQLSTPLYFSYTHLVCRTAKENANQANRRDLSHPVHSDNCVLQSNGSCLKIAPAYTWRDYSSLVYLNDEFEGGEFFFADRHTLKPAVRVNTNKCGRMVGFSAGEENLHGVLPVTDGKRCALALWFTQDESHSENWDSFQQRLGQVIYNAM